MTLAYSGQLKRLAVWYFFYFAFVGAFAPYFTLYLQDVGLNAWEIGVLMSVPQVMRLLAPNLWGWLADRLGRRAAIVRIAALFSVVGFAGFFFTRDYFPMLAAMAGFVATMVGGQSTNQQLERMSQVADLAAQAGLEWGAYQVLMGALTPYVDNSAHLGGLAGGMIMAALLPATLFAGSSGRKGDI